MAKKSKGFGELLKQQRAEITHDQALDQLQQKIQNSELGEKFAGLVKNPKGEVKMSEVLENFVDPYLGAVQNSQQRQKLFTLAVFAWNVAILPIAQQERIIETMLKESLPGADFTVRQDTRQLLDSLIARKQSLFADNQRYIVDFQLQGQDQKFHLSVASTLMAPPPK